MQWMEQLSNYLGKPIDVDGMVAAMNAPAPILNVLSVGLFAARFIVNAGIILKHVFAPTEEEKSIDIGTRLWNELYDRHCVMLNDLVWAIINLLTNYSALFNISIPVANYLMVGFLFFDISLLLYRHYLAKQEYLEKKAQYLFEKSNYETLMGATTLSAADLRKYQAYCQMLDEQLKELEISWKKTSATLSFNIAAAVFLFSGFSGTLLLANPVGMTLSFLVCTIAIAMYLSADMYGIYREKAERLNQCALEGKDTSMALLEYQAARNDFILTMTKNIIMPLLIMTIFAVCWEAAVVLTAVYIGYECTKGYFNSPPKLETLEPPLAGESAENDEPHLLMGVS